MAELRASLSSGRGAPHTQGPDSHPQYNREIKDKVKDRKGNKRKKRGNPGKRRKSKQAGSSSPEFPLLTGGCQSVPTVDRRMPGF